MVYRSAYTPPGPVAAHFGLRNETPRIFALAYYYDIDVQKPEEKWHTPYFSSDPPQF